MRVWLPVVLGLVVATGAYLLAQPHEPGREQAIAEITRFVEEHRGLKFKRPPAVRFVDDGEFERRLADANADNHDRAARLGELMQAVGLVPPNTDLLAQVTRLGADEAVGSYHVRTGELLIRDHAVTPLRRMVIAHELTHALDDQWFTLHRPLTAFDGSAWAFMTLFEGNARRIENAYRDEMSAGDRQSAQQERAAITGKADYLAVPDAVLEMTGFPYLRGPALVQAILDQGGQAALDRAFVHPPTTAQQVMYPELYLSGAPALAVAPPSVPRSPLVTGVFGAFFLRQILAADPDTADWAARAWGGDSVVTWQQGAAYCATITFVPRNPADQPRFTAALRDWAADRPHGTASESGTVTSCSTP